ncbi:hypothetical protein [Microbacterium sp.]|uniref:hypothetical protein n=1 Tax=Microbacterium sp. TaxID=51671 RepID=UPI003F97D273
MANITAQKLGPGSLKFGDTGDEQEFAVRLTTATVNPTWADPEVTPVLSGDQVSDPGEFEGTLSGSIFQDFDMEGLVAWTWDNKFTELPFVFIPRTEGGLKVTGTVQIMPLNIGGDVKTANQSEFEWKLTTEPALEANDGGGAAAMSYTSPEV